METTELVKQPPSPFLSLEVVAAAKKTQMRVSSLAHCSLHFPFCALALECFPVCGSCHPPYSICFMYAGTLENENISWNFMLPFMSSLNLQAQDVCLTCQLSRCVPHGSFPQVGIEGRCLLSCNTGKKTQGLFSN